MLARSHGTYVAGERGRPAGATPTYHLLITARLHRRSAAGAVQAVGGTIRLGSEVDMQPIEVFPIGLLLIAAALRLLTDVALWSYRRWSARADAAVVPTTTPE